MKRKDTWIKRMTVNLAAAVLAAGLFTACGLAAKEAKETAESRTEVQAEENGGKTEHPAETEAEEDFFSIMQKFSSGEIEAVPFEKLAENADPYGVVLLAEEESGLRLYGYLEPEALYEGVYIIDENNVVNAFPSIVYLTEAGQPPVMQWNGEEKLLEITVFTGDKSGSTEAVYTFKRQDSGLLVSMDEEGDEE